VKKPATQAIIPGGGTWVGCGSEPVFMPKAYRQLGLGKILIAVYKFFFTVKPTSRPNLQTTLRSDFIDRLELLYVPRYSMLDIGRNRFLGTKAN
jgi:hypothetical protein